MTKGGEPSEEGCHRLNLVGSFFTGRILVQPPLPTVQRLHHRSQFQFRAPIHRLPPLWRLLRLSGRS